MANEMHEAVTKESKGISHYNDMVSLEKIIAMLNYKKAGIEYNKLLKKSERV